MISPLEIVLIVVIIVIIAMIASVPRMGRSAVAKKVQGSGCLIRSGFVLVSAGTIVLIIAASLFRWALQGYLWALILIATGVWLVLLSRKKGDK